MDLRNTIDYMLSNDYKKRLIAEYWQTQIRLADLQRFLSKWNDDNGKPDIKEMLTQQVEVMSKYSNLLAERAEKESISLCIPKEFESDCTCYQKVKFLNNEIDIYNIINFLDDASEVHVNYENPEKPYLYVVGLDNDIDNIKVYEYDCIVRNCETGKFFVDRRRSIFG